MLTLFRFCLYLYRILRYSRFPLVLTKGDGCKLWDADGTEYCGLHYAPLSLAAADIAAPQTFKGLVKIAKMAAIAIPLRFTIKPNHPDVNKYCVLTNWWRERTRHGYYRFPSLDFNVASNTLREEEEEEEDTDKALDS